MRTDADVWILDEPTAALDPVAEQRVHDLLLRHSAGRTSVLVSHRLSAVRGADRIVVVEDGRIVEDGTHDELDSRGAGYATMFRTQARGYVEGPSVGAQAGSELTGVMTGPA